MELKNISLGLLLCVTPSCTLGSLVAGLLKGGPAPNSLTVTTSIASDISRTDSIETWDNASQSINFTSEDSVVSDWGTVGIEAEWVGGTGVHGQTTYSLSLEKLSSNGDVSYSPRIRFRWYPSEAESRLQPFLGIQLIDFFNTGFKNNIVGERVLYMGLGAEVGLKFNLNKQFFARLAAESNAFFSWGGIDSSVGDLDDWSGVSHDGVSWIFGIGLSL